MYVQKYKSRRTRACQSCNRIQTNFVHVEYENFSGNEINLHFCENCFINFMYKRLFKLQKYPLRPGLISRTTGFGLSNISSAINIFIELLL